MTSIDFVRSVAAPLPRSYEVIVRDRVKWRIKQIVWLAFSREEQTLGFAFPKEERDEIIAAEPHTFLPPHPSDLRFNWLEANVAALDDEEAREIVLGAWRLCVPKKVWTAYVGGLPQ